MILNLLKLRLKLKFGINKYIHGFLILSMFVIYTWRLDNSLQSSKKKCEGGYFHDWSIIFYWCLIKPTYSQRNVLNYNNSLWLLFSDSMTGPSSILISVYLNCDLPVPSLTGKQVCHSFIEYLYKKNPKKNQTK